MSRWNSKPLSEQRRVQRGVLTPPDQKPPTDGITSSSEALAAEIFGLHAAAASLIDKVAREIAQRHNLHGPDVIAEIYKRLRS